MTNSEREELERELKHLISVNKGESKKYFEKQLEELKNK